MDCLKRLSTKSVVLSCFNYFCRHVLCMKDLHNFCLNREVSFLKSKDVLQYYNNSLRPILPLARLPPPGTNFLGEKKGANGESRKFKSWDLLYNLDIHLCPLWITGDIFKSNCNLCALLEVFDCMIPAFKSPNLLQGNSK